MRMLSMEDVELIRRHRWFLRFLAIVFLPFALTVNAVAGFITTASCAYIEYKETWGKTYKEIFVDYLKQIGLTVFEVNKTLWVY